MEAMAMVVARICKQRRIIPKIDKISKYIKKLASPSFLPPFTPNN